MYTPMRSVATKKPMMDGIWNIYHYMSIDQNPAYAVYTGVSTIQFWGDCNDTIRN